MYSGMMPNLDYYLSQRPIHPCKMLSSGPISGSFFDVIKGFIQSVNTMESTVLVPTLLKDINLENTSWVPTLMVKCNYRELFEIYCAIKKCKSHFTEMDIDEVDNGCYRGSNKVGRPRGELIKTMTNDKVNPLLAYAIESGIGYLSPDYVIDYCQQMNDQTRTPTKVTDISSSSPTSPSSSTTTSTGSNRKQKISLDSGNWSSRGSDSVDDDFDFDSSNVINGTSSINTPNGLIDSDDIELTTTSTTIVNNVHSQEQEQQSMGNQPQSIQSQSINQQQQQQLQQQQQQLQHQPLTTILSATSINLRNLKALFNHLKEVADFVTQQYLQALQLI